MQEGGKGQKRNPRGRWIGVRAARLYTKEDLRVEEVNIPEIGSEEFLLKVEAVTICALDLRAYTSGNGRVKLPRILGHEFAGTVENVGDTFRETYKQGTRVTVNPNMICGRCENCLKGKHEICLNRYAIGVDIDGAFAEYVRIPREASNNGLVLELPENVSFEEAALTEPLAACLHGQLYEPIEVGDVVTVIGTGPIGIIHVMLAKASRASKIIACDILESRLGKAKEFGADITINTSRENFVQRVGEITKGHGSDFTIVAVSDPNVQRDALQIASYQGKVNYFGGLPRNKEVVPLDTNLIHYKELRVFGTFAQTMSEYAQSLKLIGAKRFPLDELITHRYDLKDIAMAFKQAMSKEAMKICLKP